ncbi:hypothetical protein DKX38_023235 [Salix brachista]|uniref:Uncharacterized protein n=1 Tax=Salix brachista TaxID=2182728 RepID=A0A5N5K3B1_9ROSI|nr:hypothetical protein DKX38_023235 [Salix brachista]
MLMGVSNTASNKTRASRGEKKVVNRTTTASTLLNQPYHTLSSDSLKMKQLRAWAVNEPPVSVCNVMGQTPRFIVELNLFRPPFYARVAHDTTIDEPAPDTIPPPIRVDLPSQKSHHSHGLRY